MILLAVLLFQLLVVWEPYLDFCRTGVVCYSGKRILSGLFKSASCSHLTPITNLSFSVLGQLFHPHQRYLRVAN